MALAPIASSSPPPPAGLPPSVAITGPVGLTESGTLTLAPTAPAPLPPLGTTAVTPVAIPPGTGTGASLAGQAPSLAGGATIGATGTAGAATLPGAVPGVISPTLAASPAAANPATTTTPVATVGTATPGALQPTTLGPTTPTTNPAAGLAAAAAAGTPAPMAATPATAAPPTPPATTLPPAAAAPGATLPAAGAAPAAGPATGATAAAAPASAATLPGAGASTTAHPATVPPAATVAHATTPAPAQPTGQAAGAPTDFHVYEAALAPVNGSAVAGVARATLSGHTLTVDLHASGLQPGLPHGQYLAGMASGQPDRLPVAADDLNHDGIIDSAELVRAVGQTILDLPLNAQVATLGPAAAQGHELFPTPAADGTLVYHEVFAFNAAQPQSAATFANVAAHLATGDVVVQGAGSGLALPGAVGLLHEIPPALAPLVALGEPTIIG